MPERVCQPRTYDPSPEEIRERCWQIQDTWTEAERRRRAGIFAEQERVVMVEVVELGATAVVASH